MLTEEQKRELRIAIGKVPDHDRLDTHSLVWQLIRREKLAEAVYRIVKETIEVDARDMKARDELGRYITMPRLEQEVGRMELVEPEQWGAPILSGDFVIDGNDVEGVREARRDRWIGSKSSKAGEG